MHRTKIILCAAALLLCAVVCSAWALEDSTLTQLWRSGCDFLFHTDNVTVTGEANLALDGEHFKTVKLNYVQAGYRSSYDLTLLSPKRDGGIRENGWLIVADENNNCSIIEKYSPDVYRTTFSVPQNSLLRRTIQLDALTELGGVLIAPVEALLPEGTVTVAEGDGTRTVHIALTQEQVPDMAQNALNLAAGYLMDRWFNYDFNRSLLASNDIAPFEDFGTVTEALTWGTVRWTLKSADVNFALDAQNRLAAVKGTVQAVSTFWDGTERVVELQLDAAVSDYGTSTVKHFDPADYNVAPAYSYMEFMPDGEPGPETDVEIDSYDSWVQPQGTLPAYVYPGDDPFEKAIADYTASLGKTYALPEGAASIPVPVVLKTETPDDTHTLVYGNFWVLNYVLNGTTMRCTSGGENPGILTLEKKDGAWEVTDFEKVSDGEYYPRDITRICKGDTDLEGAFFASATLTRGVAKDTRRQYIRDYVLENGLNVLDYQDYGWSPISLFPSEANRVITALASEVNPEHLESLAVDARITGYSADTNELTVELLVPERFSAEEVESLSEGDAIYTEGREIYIDSMDQDMGYVVLNPSEDFLSEDTVWMFETGDGTYMISDADDHTWVALDSIQVPVTDHLLFLDGIDPDDGGMLDLPAVHTGAEFVSMLQNENNAPDPGFAANNVWVAFDDAGQLAMILRYYVPWQ